MKTETLIGKRRNRGFTLTEVLVYIAVLTVITASASSFFLWISRTNNKARAAREVLNNIRIAMDAMTHEIREGKSIYASTSAFLVDNGQLSLETIKYLPVGENTSYIDFYICEERLCLKKENQQTPVALTSDRVEIERLKFSEIATTSTVPSIQIELKINYQTPSVKPEDQFSINTTSTVSLRNY